MRFFITITGFLLVCFVGAQVIGGNVLFDFDKEKNETGLVDNGAQVLTEENSGGSEITTSSVDSTEEAVPPKQVSTTPPKKNTEGELPDLTPVQDPKKEVHVLDPVEQEHPSDLLGDLDPTVIINLTNKERQSRGMAPLYRNRKLDNAALKKALDMFERQYFAHDSPTGVTIEDLASGVSYDFVALGENLAYGGFETEQDMVAGWMNSPGHKANILSGKYTEIGAAVVKGLFNGKEVWMGVQEFGKPAAACPTVDETLKINIEKNSTDLDVIAQKITEKKEVLQTADPATDLTYDAEVDEINALVIEHNALVQKIKTWIEEYNKSVAQYNLCAKG